MHLDAFFGLRCTRKRAKLSSKFKKKNPRKKSSKKKFQKNQLGDFRLPLQRGDSDKLATHIQTGAALEAHALQGCTNGPPQICPTLERCSQALS